GLQASQERMWKNKPSDVLASIRFESQGGREKDAKELDWSKRVNVAKGVAHALSYLHHNCVPPIIHRDTSSKIVLLNSEMEAHVPDFGTARVLKPDSSNWTAVAGTFEYIALGNVTGLNLAYTGLQGTLDHLNFSYFPLLLRLDLKVNRLNGTIPTNICLLSNLVYLDLSTNSFSGTIPLSVANLTKVVELDFGRNPITGQLDPRLFPDRGSSQAKTGLLSLQRLLFQSTLLSGPLPPEIGNLEDLTILALDDSRFSGPIPQSLVN
ncbi:hypothetical protein C3L33_15180, partial [Rhododendron williamsianum]